MRRHSRPIGVAISGSRVRERARRSRRPARPGAIRSATVIAPRPLAAPILLTALGFALAGCGDKTVDTAALKQQLSGVADALDACVAKTSDARKCTTEEALGKLPDGTELGADTGQIKVQANKPLRYELVAEVGDDVQFSVVAAPVGARKRFCLPAGRGDCPNSGAW